jgi:hypothetical protein
MQATGLLCHRGCPGSTSKQVFIKCMVCISLVCPLFKSFKCIRRALLYVELVLIARGASKAFGQFGLHLATDLYHYIILWITESLGVPLAFLIMKLIQVIRPTQGVGHSISALSLHCGTSTGSISDWTQGWCDTVRQLSDFDQNSLIVRLIVFPLRLFPFDADLGRLVIGQSAWKNASRKISP